MDILLSLFGFLSGMRRPIKLLWHCTISVHGPHFQKGHRTVIWRSSLLAVFIPYSRKSFTSVALSYIQIPMRGMSPVVIRRRTQSAITRHRTWYTSLSTAPSDFPLKLKAGDVFIASAVQEINHISYRSCLQVLDFTRRLEIVDTATQLYALTTDCSRWWKNLSSWCSYSPPPGELPEVDSMQVSTGRAVLYSIPVVSYQACGYIT